MSLLRRGAHLHGLQEWFSESGVLPHFEVLELPKLGVPLKAREAAWFVRMRPEFYGKYPDDNGAWKITRATNERISAAVKAHADARGDYTRDANGEVVREHVCCVCGTQFWDRKRDRKTCSRKCATTLAHKRFDVDEAVSLYREGWSFRKLAGKYGVSRMAIQRSFSAAGVSVRPNTLQGNQLLLKIELSPDPS